MVLRYVLSCLVLALSVPRSWAQECNRPDTGRQTNPVTPEGPTAPEAGDATAATGALLGDALRTDLLGAWEWAAPPQGGDSQPNAVPDGAAEIHSSTARTPGADPAVPPCGSPGDRVGALAEWMETVDSTIRRVKTELWRWTKLPAKWLKRIRKSSPEIDFRAGNNKGKSVDDQVDDLLRAKGYDPGGKK